MAASRAARNEAISLGSMAPTSRASVAAGSSATESASMAGQLTALRREISEAAVMTGEAGSPQLGDAGLWSYIAAAIHRAGTASSP